MKIKSFLARVGRSGCGTPFGASTPLPTPTLPFLHACLFPLLKHRFPSPAIYTTFFYIDKMVHF